MKAFYQNLHRGLQKDEALRQSKLQLIKSPQPPGIILLLGLLRHAGRAEVNSRAVIFRQSLDGQ
jgi:CHAT domain-containing protein